MMMVSRDLFRRDVKLAHLFLFFTTKWLPYAVSKMWVDACLLRSSGAKMHVSGIARPSGIDAIFVRRCSTFESGDVGHETGTTWNLCAITTLQITSDEVDTSAARSGRPRNMVVAVLFAI